MATTERVTVTLPAGMLERIDRFAPDRSQFVAEAVARELARRSREGLRQSLQHSHPETCALAEVGLTEWAERLPTAEEWLVDASAGQAVRWGEGEGWKEGAPP